VNQSPGFNPYQHQSPGFTSGDTCPLCRGFGGTSPHTTFVRACSLCGGPRIPMPAGVALDEAAQAELRRADERRKSAGLATILFGFSVAGLVLGAMATLALSLLNWKLGLAAALFTVAPSAAAALTTRRRAARASVELAPLVERAWNVAASQLVRGGHAKSAADLDRIFGVGAERAQQLFLLASVELELGGSTGVRIDTAGVAPLPPDPRFARLEQAEAEASAAIASEQTQTGEARGPR
jgi:hypothetical protein